MCCFLLMWVAGVLSTPPPTRSLGIGVLSTSTHTKLRHTARHTWMQYPQQVPIKFFIATPSDPTLLELVLAEQDQWGDIVISPQLEAYRNTTYQVLAMARWFSEVQPVNLILKTDDDTFVRVDRVLDWATSTMDQWSSRDLLYGGNMIEGATVHRVGKYQVPLEEYPDETYPPMARGPAYIFSGALAIWLTERHRQLPLRIFRLEDVSIALWADEINQENRDKIADGYSPGELDCSRDSRKRPVHYIREPRFHSIRVCDERAFTILLEEGRPLERNITQTNYDLWHAIKHNTPRVCPVGTTLVDCGLKAKVRAHHKSPTDPTALQELQTAEQEWINYYRPAKRGARVLLYDDVKSNHYYMHAEGTVQGCSVPCVYTSDRAQLEQVDVVVFNGDEEFYVPVPDRELPQRSLEPTGHNGPRKRAILFREAITKLQPHKWRKYDFNITYSLADQVVYPYLDSIDNLLAQARQSMAVPKDDSGLAPVAFVGLRCGPDEGRVKRATWIQELMGVVAVDSYGQCLNNRPWPEGHERDKQHVMQRHHFCLAIENTMDPYYHTEKLFDCWRAASVPIYQGHRATIERFLPSSTRSALLIDDFDSVEALAAEVRRLASDPVAYESYRAWIQNPPAEWVAFMRSIEGRGVPCRLCEFVARQREEWKPRLMYDAVIDNMHWDQVPFIN